MRLRPPFWAFGRTTIAEDNIGGYVIDAGTQLLLCPFLTHRHPEFWDNPEAFDPGRFREEARTAMHPLQYVPFGAGARKCIGASFAMMEMQLVLPMIVQALELWRLPGSQDVLEPEVVLRPRGGMWMTAHPR